MTLRTGFAAATDIVVFTVVDGKLQILLIERGADPFRGKWALPGGFVRPDEGLDDCASRELREETGAHGVYLEQLYSFGEVNRDPRGRVISVAYFALVPQSTIELRSGTDAAKAQWHPVRGIPPLAFDHAEVVKVAVDRLAAKLEYSTIAFQLLPDRFTMREVYEIYQAILGVPLDRRNFYKKMLASGDLVATSERRLEGAHRPAAVYRLKKPRHVRITK